MKIRIIFNLRLFLDCAGDIYMSLVDRLRSGHIYVPWDRHLRLFSFYNKSRKYVIIRLHNLKIDTDIAHIEPLQIKKKR